MIQNTLMQIFSDLVQKVGGNSRASELLGVSRQRISYYTTGKNQVPEGSLQKLAEIANMELSISITLKKPSEYDKTFLTALLEKAASTAFQIDMALGHLENHFELEKEDILLGKKCDEFYEYLRTHSQWQENERVPDELGNTIGLRTPEGEFIPL